MKSLMSKRLLLLLVVVTFTFNGAAFSAVLETPKIEIEIPTEPKPSEPDGDGGPGPGGPIPDYPQRFHENVHLLGLDLNASVENYGNRTSAYFWSQLQRDLKFKSGYTNFTQNKENPSRFYFNADVQFEVLDVSQSDYSLDFEKYSNINFHGMDMNSSLRVENEEWVWDVTKDEGELIVTDDIEIHYGLNLTPFEGYSNIIITDINLHVNEWFNEWEDETVLNLSFHGSGYCHSPEPATIGLMLIGSLALIKQRRKIC